MIKAPMETMSTAVVDNEEYGYLCPRRMSVSEIPMKLVCQAKLSGKKLHQILVNSVLQIALPFIISLPQRDGRTMNSAHEFRIKLNSNL